MPVSIGSNCLTRVVVDDDHDIQIAQLQLVMHRIQDSLRHVPVSQREYIANALLNLAVARMLKEEGASHTAGILARRQRGVRGAPRAAAGARHRFDQTGWLRSSVPVRDGAAKRQRKLAEIKI